ncbi:MULTISPECIES: hypothetical protein [unclassified Enterococcus]|jgi:hypothetical protein|uniref:hypothetical protein n=1 Tax=unclassified Enterococcus TaxID=2608891 RepID=UPI0003544AF1|nr:hypothetical protein D920_02194 [Enterococcus faecalis 13-SD-W-01]
MVAFIRFAALSIIGLSYFIYKIHRKNEHKKNDGMTNLNEYEKDENGLYPWEADQDDSPQRIEKTATRYVNQARPRRGRW